jgi:ABC-2 type transport system ATP-binding protein
LTEGKLIAYGTPDELRRDALGGEVVEVTMQGMFDVSTLRDAPGVKGMRQTGPKTFQLIVDDAGTATPDAIQAMSERGAEVETVRELRPTFEEVFAALVERARSSGAEGAQPADAPDPTPEDTESGTKAAA